VETSIRVKPGSFYMKDIDRETPMTSARPVIRRPATLLDGIQNEWRGGADDYPCIIRPAPPFTHSRTTTPAATIVATGVVFGYVASRITR
jgi:hypothetical protein